MAKSETSESMASAEENVTPEQVVWEPSEGESPKNDDQVEKPVVTPVESDSEVTKENGHMNGSANEGIIEEPESDPEEKQSQISSVNIEEVPEESESKSDDVNTEEVTICETTHAESSGGDEPLSHLKKPIETPDLVHAAHSPNPFAHIRGRPGLRSASPYRTQSVPVSPINFGFAPLTRVDGELSLQREPDRKRPRVETTTTGPNSKRPCRGWPSLANWWKGGNEQPQSATETLGNPNPRACTLM